LTEKMAFDFEQEWERSGFIPVAAHDSYLINLAAREEQILQRSIEAFTAELNRVTALGIAYLITHPGAHRGLGIRAGVERYVENLDLAMSKAHSSGVTVLVETTAGQGTCIGSTFEEIASILDRSRYGDRMGVCFDTCHSFVAGYDIRTPATYQETFSRFEQIVGLDRLRFFHLNDSKGSLGSRLDRHEHIGKGAIGLEGFRMLLNDPRFLEHPMVLETPKGEDLQNDRRNLRVLRSLLEA